MQKIIDRATYLGLFHAAALTSLPDTPMVADLASSSIELVIMMGRGAAHALRRSVGRFGVLPNGPFGAGAPLGTG